ncbi:MAG: CdaR family protein [Thermoanaerobaculia bacterium]
MIRRHGPKLLALMIAVAVWVGASEDRREEIVEKNFDIPITFVGIPSNVVMSGDLTDDQLSVRLRGPASQIRALSSENLEATIDLMNARPGRLDIPISRSSLNLPENVEVASIQPARLRLELELRRQKVVSIRPYWVGSPAEGFVFDGYEVRPANALITGPSSIVDEVTEVPTERIILTETRTPFRETVAVISDYPLVQVLQPATAEVAVSIVPLAPPEPVDVGADTP